MNRSDFTILSGAHTNRFNSKINHQNYADYWNYNYEFRDDIDCSNAPNEGHPAFIKIYAILDALTRYSKVMWIDEDAFFIDFDWNCFDCFGTTTKPILVSESHNIKTQQISFNSGVMFIRRSPKIFKMFKKVLEITHDKLEQEWNDEWGPLQGNDQPRLIYLTHTDYQDIHHISSYLENRWNKRPRHTLKSRCNIVHFAGGKKLEKIKDWEQKAGISLTGGSIHYRKNSEGIIGYNMGI